MVCEVNQILARPLVIGVHLTNHMSATPQLHELIAKRWSPRNFNGKEVEPEKLRSVFEAAIWASSCFNEQPWRFLVASRTDKPQFDRLLGLLVEKNQGWAKSAGALGISFGKKTFSHSGAADRFGLHDAGAALAQLSLQAVALGLHAHGMGGFDAARTRTEFAIPDDFEVGAAFAIGYLESDDSPPSGRGRKPLAEVVFTGEWGDPADFSL
jgi:nitroreductase